MGALIKLRDGQLSLEDKIERWRRGNKQPPPHAQDGVTGFKRPAAGNVIPALTNETLLDLPRGCAVTRRPWAARYLRDDAAQDFRYIRSVIPDGRMRLTLYRPEDVRLLPDFEAGIEDCPHCGAYTPEGCMGSVWCDACRSWVCYGLTSYRPASGRSIEGEGLFICGCGQRGTLVECTQTALGLVLR